MMLSMVWNMIVITISFPLLLFWVRQVVRIMPSRPAIGRASMMGSLI
jgi:hypothetical protein